MKKIIIALAILSGVALCWAAPPTDKLPALLGPPQALARNIMILIGSPPVTSSTAYCTGAATCTATTPGQCDVICEDFEGTTDCDGVGGGDANCRAGWTVFGAANSVDWTTTHSGTFSCNDKGTNSAQFNWTADTQLGYYKSADADKALSYAQFYINFTATTLGNHHSEGFFYTIDSTLANTPYALCLYNDEGTFKLRLYYSDVSLSSTGSTAISVGTNTWYRIRIMYNRTAGTATVKLNDTTEIDITSGVTGPTPRVFGIGTGGGFTNGESFTFQIDNIAVDDDTEQGACN